MFDTAVAVGVFHKSENRLNVNPTDDTVFQPGDQVVALSTTGALVAPCLAWGFYCRGAVVEGTHRDLIEQCMCHLSQFICLLVRLWDPAGYQSAGHVFIGYS